MSSAAASKVSTHDADNVIHANVSKTLASSLTSHKEVETFQEEINDSFKWMKEIRDDTNEFNDILNVETKTVTAEAIYRFCKYLQDFIMQKHPSSTKHKVAAREGFVWISKFIIEVTGAFSFYGSINNIIFHNFDNQELLRTETIRDALVSLAKYCATADSAQYFCVSIWNMTCHDKNKSLFGTAAVRDSLLLVSKYCTSYRSAANFCGSISNLNNLGLLRTEAIRQALIAASDHSSDESSRAISKLFPGNK